MKRIIRQLPVFSVFAATIAATSPFLSPIASAQTAPDAGSLQREAEKDRGRKLEQIPQVETDAKPVKKPGAPEVPVTTFIFEGNTVLTDAQLQKVVDPWRGKALTLEELKWLTGKISERYRKDGYLARVMLPQQNIQQGSLKIVIIEARLGDVVIKKNQTNLRIEPEVIENTLRARHRSGDFLKINNIERASLILNDTPGFKIKPSLTASRSAGATDVTVEVNDEPLLSGLVSVDNYGARSTGRPRLTPVLKIANPSGIGDDVQIVGLFSEGNLYARSRYSRPIGYDGFRLGGSVSYLKYDLGEEFEDLDAEGTASTIGLDASYPLIRQQEKNLRILSSLSHENYDNDQLGESVSEKTINAISIGISGDVLDKFGGGGITFYSLDLSAGDLDLSDNELNEAQDELGPETAGNYEKLTWSLGRLQKLFTTTNLWLGINGQFSSKNLDSSETMSLGGMGGVRAYPILEASGDDGWIATAEVRHSFSANLVIIPFIDYGQVTERSTNLRGEDRHDLKGAGIGADWTFADDFVLRASVARRIGKNPLSDPVTGDDSDGSYHRWPVWVSLSRYF